MDSTISATEKEFIKEESKKLLTEFSRKLEAIKGDFDFSFASSESRKEGSGWECPEDFREAIFQNAPLVDEDLIIAEKGAWKNDNN